MIRTPVYQPVCQGQKQTKNIYSPFALQMQNTHFITAIICNAFWESLDAGQQTWWLAAQEKIKTAVGKGILASLSHWSNPRALLTQFLLGDESKCLSLAYWWWRILIPTAGWKHQEENMVFAIWRNSLRHHLEEHLEVRKIVVELKSVSFNHIQLGITLKSPLHSDYHYGHYYCAKPGNSTVVMFSTDFLDALCTCIMVPNRVCLQVS